MKNHYLIVIFGLVLGSLFLTGCRVNSDIDIPANAHLDDGERTVNGDVTIGANAIVDGDLSTVNGSITAGAGARIGVLTTVNGEIHVAHDVHSDKLRSVNGSIGLGKNAAVKTDVTSVNGDISTEPGVNVGGNVTNVNGDISICNAQVGGNIEFANGTLLISQNSQIKGTVTVKQPKSEMSSGTPPPVIIVGPHATVSGSIVFQQPGKLYVSDSAVIHDVHGATPQKFSGATPTDVRTPACSGN